jgi:hypothetical protein
MHAVVIEHVKVKDLPELWRDRWVASPDAQVTIRIEEEPAEMVGSDPFFGMWRDRNDLMDVDHYVRSLRRSRFSQDQ